MTAAGHSNTLQWHTAQQVAVDKALQSDVKTVSGHREDGRPSATPTDQRALHGRGGLDHLALKGAAQLDDDNATVGGAG
jgi:hypothetical protein